MTTMATATKARVLIVDDDRIILDSLGEFLRFEGYAVMTARSFTEAMRTVDQNTVELILCDVNMPGGNGFELLHAVRKRAPETAVIMMTGYGTIESAVEAIKMGAYDYLTKPIIDDELKLCTERALAQQAIVRENRVLKERLSRRDGIANIIGQDYRMRKVFDLVESVASSDITVLIHGASGTGKSLLARAIHQESDRQSGPFVEISCGAIPETLLESELFGHARGAFTGAIKNKPGKFKAADHGTIFLDEIAAASPALQVKLLRVLQSHEFEALGSNKTETVDVRVILATNLDLAAEVREGRFREDLYYRVHVVSIEMPTLAQRVGDIPRLAKSFLERFSQETKRAGTGRMDFDPEALEALQSYHWPGNVRELENAVLRAVVLCKGRTITTDHLPPTIIEAVAGLLDSAGQAEAGLTDEPKPLREALEAPEKRIIESALLANGGNRQLTAQQLCINRTTLYKKMKRYGL